MKNSICCLVIFVLTCGGLTHAEEKKSVSLNGLRAKLALAKKVAMDTNFNIGEETYIKLIQAGEPGFEILSEAWAYDGLPEENWISWNHDFMTRFSDDNKVTDAYDQYFLKKCQRNKIFAAAALKRYRTEKVYGDEFFLSTLKSTVLDDREKGYGLLKTLLPTVPAFDPKADEKIRAKQIQAIESFLKGQAK